MEKKLKTEDELKKMRDAFIGEAPSKAKAMERSLLLSSNFGSAEARAEMDRQFRVFVAENRVGLEAQKKQDIWELMSPEEQIKSLKKQMETLQKNQLINAAKEEGDNLGEIALSAAEMNRYDIDRIDGFGLTKVFPYGKNIAVWTKNPFISCKVYSKMLRASVTDGYFYDPSLVSGSANPMGDLQTKDHFLWEEEEGLPSPFNTNCSTKITLLSSGIYVLLMNGGAQYSTSTADKLVRLSQSMYVTATLYDSVGGSNVIGTADGSFYKYCRMPRIYTMKPNDFGFHQPFIIDGDYGPYEIKLSGYGTYTGVSSGSPSVKEVSIYLGHDQDGAEEYEEYDSEFYNFVYSGVLSVIKIA